jgi:hypothetical protein
MHRILFILLFLLLSIGKTFAAGEIDESSFEAEDFDVQEEGMLFDHSRTGLMYRRNVYLHDENMTFLPQQPSIHNSTIEKREWTVHISHWDVEPPSSIVVHVIDDTPYQTSGSLIDIQVRIGQADRSGNFVIANTVVRTDIPIQSGYTRVPINIHNYAGDIFSAFIIGVRPKMAYQAIGFGQD